MARYRAKATLHIAVGGNSVPRFVPAGEEFDSDSTTPGLNWWPLDDAATAAFVARHGKAPDDRPQNFGLGGAGSLWPRPKFGGR